MHDGFSIMDVSNSVCRNKAELLMLVQKWKSIIRNDRATKISIIDSVTPDCIALFFAAIELNVEIFAVAKGEAHIMRAASTVDKVYVSDLVFPRSIGLKNDNITFYSPARFAELTDEYSEEVNSGTSKIINVYTSGTTGEPKLLSHSVDTLINAASLSAAEYYSVTDSVVTHMNFNHVGVISIGVLSPIIAGARMLTTIDMGDLFYYLQRKLVTKLLAFEVTLRVIRDANDINVDFSGVTIITGGKVVSRSFVDWCLSKNAAAIVSVYGTSECLPPVLHGIFNKDKDDNLSIMTHLQPGYIVNIQDNELMLKGPGVSRFYESDDGWYHTGDNVSQVSESEFLYIGRKNYPVTANHEFEFDNCINSSLVESDIRFVFPHDYATKLDGNDVAFTFTNARIANTVNIPKLSKAIAKIGFNLVDVYCSAGKFGEIKRTG